MGRQVRICNTCESHNDISNYECWKCGDDLICTKTMEIPDEIDDESKNENSTNSVKTLYCPSRFIKNIIDNKSIEIPLEGCILGRMGNIEIPYFNQFPYISNIHASLEYNCEDLVVVDLESRNGTRVNGEKLNPKEQRVLKIGDTIKIANIEFIVHE